MIIVQRNWFRFLYILVGLGKKKKKNPSWDLFKNSTATLGVYIGAAAFGNARAV